MSAEQQRLTATEVLRPARKTICRTSWAGHRDRPFGDVTVPVIGHDALIGNKRATGRARELGGIEGPEK